MSTNDFYSYPFDVHPGAAFPVAGGGMLSGVQREKVQFSWPAYCDIRLKDPEPDNSENEWIETTQRLRDDAGRIYEATPYLHKRCILAGLYPALFDYDCSMDHVRYGITELPNDVNWLIESSYLLDTREEQIAAFPNFDYSNSNTFRIHRWRNKYCGVVFKIMANRHLAYFQIRKGGRESSVGVGLSHEDKCVHREVEPQEPIDLEWICSPFLIGRLLFRGFPGKSSGVLLSPAIMPALFHPTDEVGEPQPNIEYVPPR
ncbi:MAG: hypothetical protein AAGD00_03395 [Planctomycetota bacterium]